MRFLPSFSFPSGDSQALREFLAYLPGAHGDLSTISTPTPLLAPKSMVEYPATVALHHSLFLLPTNQSSPTDRAVSILKNYICTLRAQAESHNLNSSGGTPDDTQGRESLKKPLNSFLGELFFAKVQGGGGDGIGETEVICEQVGHHPPVTASYLVNNRSGISVQAHLGQLTKFAPTAGSINITQKGHALTHIARYDEHHLATFPILKIRGLFSFGGSNRYMEYSGTCWIVSSAGLVTRIGFEEERSRRSSISETLGWSSNTKNEERGLERRVSATISRWREVEGGEIEQDEQPLVTVSGSWNGSLTIKEIASGKEEIFDIGKVQTADIKTQPIEKQTQWESQRAWGPTKYALAKGDWKKAAEEKRRIEEWQRGLRRVEETDGRKWEPRYFGVVEQCKKFESLARVIGVEQRDRLGDLLWRVNTNKEAKGPST
ncbi:hypothetical protein ABW20_dc0101341 [Dactylellina cionopaga]|nr:hypothetical protein ABW20_dc0101341 [Dactylellina cionopaga]